MEQRGGTELGGGATATQGRETLSQLVAKILDQLSVSAWLPAAILVVVFLLAWSIRQAHDSIEAGLSTRDGVLREAIHDIGGMDFQSLVLLVATVVLVTTLTQAFSFGAIRIFEGYWGSGWLFGWTADVLRGHHRRKKNRMEHRVEKLNSSAFADARQVMLDEGIPRPIVDIIEAGRAGAQVAGVTDAQREQARAIDWQAYAPESDVPRAEVLESRLEDYPEDDYRLLPTRLGNILRSYEDRVILSSQDSLPHRSLQLQAPEQEEFTR